MALRALRDALDAARAEWMCIGGVAVIAAGVRRTTTDVDVTVRGDGVDIRQLLRRLATHEIQPREDDPAAFAERSQMLLLRHAPTGVQLDLSLAWLVFEHDAIAAHSRLELWGVDVPLARPEDLLIYKLFAARPVDLKDADALLALHRRSIDLRRVRRVLAELGELSGEDAVAGRLDRLEAAIKTLQPKRRRRKRPKK